MEEPFPYFLFQSEDTMQFLSWARPLHFSPAGTGLQDSSATGVFSICGLLLVTEQNPPMSLKFVFVARLGRSSAGLGARQINSPGYFWGSTWFTEN